jgi:hypothetical protein
MFCKYFQEVFSTQATDPKQALYIEVDKGEEVSVKSKSMACICNLFKEDSAFNVYSIKFGSLGEETLQLAESCQARDTAKDEYFVITRKESQQDARILFLMEFIQHSLPNSNFIPKKHGLPLFLTKNDPLLLLLEPMTLLDRERWSERYERLLFITEGDFLEFGAHNGMNVIHL